MTRRMVRCVQGHPFDANAHETCPICASREAKVSAAPTEGSVSNGLRGEQAAPSPAPWHKTPLIWTVAGVAFLGATVYMLQPKTVPPVPANPPDLQKQASTDRPAAPSPAPAPAPPPEAIPAPQSTVRPIPVPAPAAPAPPLPTMQPGKNAATMHNAQRILTRLAQNSTDIEPPWIKRRDPPDQWAMGAMDDAAKKAFQAAQPTANVTKGLLLYLSGFTAQKKNDLPTALLRYEAGYYFGCAICTFALAGPYLYDPAFPEQRSRAQLWMAIAERIGIADAGPSVAFFGPGARDLKLMRGETPAGGIKVGAYSPRDSFMYGYARNGPGAMQIVDVARRGDSSAQNTLKRIGVDINKLPEMTIALAGRLIDAGDKAPADALDAFIERAAGGDSLALHILSVKSIANPVLDFDVETQLALSQAAAVRGKERAMIKTAELANSIGRTEVNTPGGPMNRADQAIFAFAGQVFELAPNQPVGPAIEPYLARLDQTQRNGLEPYFKGVTSALGKRW